MINETMKKVDSDYWDAEVEIGRIEKSESTDIVISACRKSGKNYLNIREWYVKKDEWFPGRNGITFKMEDVPDVMTGIQKAMEQLNHM